MSSRLALMGAGGPGITQIILLLDESGLGSAAAAYSVRKMRDAYAGSCLRVRRSSDNAEQDIGFIGSPAELDTSSMLTFVGANNGFVVTWFDQSGNASDITQATAANQPQIVSGGSLITGANSKAALAFNGSQWLRKASGMTINQGATFFLVMYQDTWTLNDYIFDGQSVNTMYLAQRTASPGIRIDAAGSTGGPSTTDLAVDAWGLVTLVVNGASSTVRVNGGSEASGTVNAGNITGFLLGGAGSAINLGDFNIQEVVIYSTTPKTSGEQTTARNNINGHYLLF